MIERERWSNGSKLKFTREAEIKQPTLVGRLF